MGQTTITEHTGQLRNTYRCVAGQTSGKGPLEGTSYRWKNIKIDFRETRVPVLGLKLVGWNFLTTP
jgi:hypothetical protein